jgi:hypothetical protein
MMKTDAQLRAKIRRLRYGEWPEPQAVSVDSIDQGEAVAIPYIVLAYLREPWEYLAAVWLFARAPRRAITVKHLGGYLGEVWGCSSTEARDFLRRMDALGVIELRSITQKGHRYVWRITFGRETVDAAD